MKPIPVKSLGYKNAHRSISVFLKNGRPLRSLKERAKENRKRRQKVPSRTAKQKGCFSIKPMFIMQAFSCILILPKPVETQIGDYPRALPFPSKITIAFIQSFVYTPWSL